MRASADCPDRLALLQKIASSLSASRTIDQAAQIVLNHAADALALSGLAVFLADYGPIRWVVRAADHSGQDTTFPLMPPALTGLLQEFLLSGEAVFCETLETLHERDHDLVAALAAEGFRSLAVLPLAAEGGPPGRWLSSSGNLGGSLPRIGNSSRLSPPFCAWRSGACRQASAPTAVADQVEAAAVPCAGRMKSGADPARRETALLRPPGEDAARLGRFVTICREVLAEKTVEGLLRRVVDAARDLSGAVYGAAGYGYATGAFDVTAFSWDKGATPLTQDEIAEVTRGGLHLELLCMERRAVRCTPGRLHRHSAWHEHYTNAASPGGMLGTRLTDGSGKSNGLVILSDKATGEFTAEDETLIAQLAELAELGLQRIEARREAERRAAQLDAILQNLNEGVTVLDARGRTILRNHMAEMISGPADDEGFGIGAYQATGPAVLGLDGIPVPFGDLPAVRLLQGETTVQEEFYYLHRDGTRNRIAFAGNLVRDEHGEPSMAVLTMRDVTALRELEQSKDDFLRMVSHDLRSPLAVIQSWAQLAERAAEDPAKVRSCMVKIATAVNRMNSMIRDLVDAARLESGRLKTQTQRIEMQGYVESLLEQVKTVLDTGRGRISCAAALPAVEADPTASSGSSPIS